jgi:hypothetical protein
MGEFIVTPLHGFTSWTNYTGIVMDNPSLFLL